jgi:hypothetical protein
MSSRARGIRLGRSSRAVLIAEEVGRNDRLMMIMFRHIRLMPPSNRGNLVIGCLPFVTVRQTKQRAADVLAGIFALSS